MICLPRIKKAEQAERSENLQDSERPLIATPIKTSAEQSNAHQAAHASDITLSDSSMRAQQGRLRMILEKRTSSYVEAGKIFSTAGVVRHEVAQGLGEIYDWKTGKVYYRKAVPVIFKEEPILLSDYLRPNDVGWEQAIADLYAIAHGGCGKRVIESKLKHYFESLLKLMKKKRLVPSTMRRNIRGHRKSPEQFICHLFI